MLIVERGYFRVVMAHDTDGKIPLLVQINLDMTGEMDLRGVRRCLVYKRALLREKRVHSLVDLCQRCRCN